MDGSWSNLKYSDSLAGSPECRDRAQPQSTVDRGPVSCDPSPRVVQLKCSANGSPPPLRGQSVFRRRKVCVFSAAR